MENIFGERLKKLRIDSEVSQSKLAKVLRKYQQDIARWEAGEILPNAKALVQLALYFDVTIDYLMGLSNDMYAGGRKRKDDPHMETVITGNNKGVVLGGRVSGNRINFHAK